MNPLASLLASPPPDAAIQIAPDAVSAAVLGVRGGEFVVQGFASEPLPPGAVTAALTHANIAARPVVADVLRTVLDRLAIRPRRVGLVVPDLAARVSLIRFDTVPPRRDDLDQLVRWQLRRTAPFPIDDAAITYALASHGSAGGDFVTVIARREIVREYESVCEDLGMHAGLVDVATLSVLSLVEAMTPSAFGDQLIVYMRPESTSLTILRGRDLIFFRSRPEDEDTGLADVVHQTAMYYQDRLSGTGFQRVVLGGTARTASGFDLARQQIEERIATPIDMLDPARVAAMADRITVAPELRAALAPLVGLLVRSRVATVAA